MWASRGLCNMNLNLQYYWTVSLTLTKSSSSNAIQCSFDESTIHNFDESMISISLSLSIYISANSGRGFTWHELSVHGAVQHRSQRFVAEYKAPPGPQELGQERYNANFTYMCLLLCRSVQNLVRGGLGLTTVSIYIWALYSERIEINIFEMFMYACLGSPCRGLSLWWARGWALRGEPRPPRRIDFWLERRHQGCFHSLARSRYLPASPLSPGAYGALGEDFVPGSVQTNAWYVHVFSVYGVRMNVCSCIAKLVL
jgi:hypothetical protein